VAAQFGTLLADARARVSMHTDVPPHAGVGEGPGNPQLGAFAVSHAMGMVDSSSSCRVIHSSHPWVVQCQTRLNAAGMIWTSRESTGVHRLRSVPLHSSAPSPHVRVNPSRLVIGVLGGSGGVGASVVAAGLALRATEGARNSVLVDLDPAGGGADLLLGVEQQPGQRWSDLCTVRGSLDVEVLAPVVHPQHPGLHVLAWPRAGADVETTTIAAVLDACRTRFDTVVVDLPRQSLPPALLTQVDRLLVVTGVDVRACAAASVIARDASAQTREMSAATTVSAVVRGPGPTPHDAVHIAEFLGLPLAGEVLWEPRLAQDIEDGRAPGSRRRGQIWVGCEQVLSAMAAPIPRRRRA
jgi:secretion/DNA translocation related CpaE-like protein